MRTLWETTALLGVALLLTACEPAPTPAPTPAPSTPSSIPAPTPTPAPAPTPAAGSYKVKLSWTAPSTRSNGKALPLGEISGYRVYYLREGSNASDDVTVSVPGGNTTSYSVTLGTAGSYTFAVTAVDVNGLESPLSGEVTVPVN
jgi:hypothetical protein